MPKKLNFNAKEFISDYQSQNNIGYCYTIRELATKYKISLFSVNTYRKLFGLSRGKGNSRFGLTRFGLSRGKGNSRNKCKICKYEFEICTCGGVTLGIAHG